MNNNERAPKQDFKAMVQAAAATPVKTFKEENRKKGGRPPLDESKKVKKTPKTIYLSDDEIDTITAAAEKNGLNLQAFAKLAIFTYIKNQ